MEASSTSMLPHPTPLALAPSTVVTGKRDGASPGKLDGGGLTLAMLERIAQRVIKLSSFLDKEGE